MGFGAIRTTDLRYYAPAFVVSINGTELRQDVISVQVDEKINAPAEAIISVNDEFDMRKQSFKWLDSDSFKVGSRVEVEMGYAGNLQQMMLGEITGLDPSLFTGSAPTVRLTVKDPMHVITKEIDPEDRREFNNRASRGVKDSEIAEFIAQIMSKKSGISLSPEVDATSVKHERIQLPDRTRLYDFLQERARQLYYEFYVRDDTFYFIGPRVEQSEILTLQWGKDLIRFSPTVSSAEVVTEVKVRSRNSATGEDIEGSAQAKDKNLASKLIAKFYDKVEEVKKEITNIPVFSREEADLIATAALNRARGSLIKGEGETIGMPEIRPGVNIKLESLGQWFSGKYYVEEATHTIDSRGYRTVFRVRRNTL